MDNIDYLRSQHDHEPEAHPYWSTVIDCCEELSEWATRFDEIRLWRRCRYCRMPAGVECSPKHHQCRYQYANSLRNSVQPISWLNGMVGYRVSESVDVAIREIYSSALYQELSQRGLLRNKLELQSL